tara:strand:- start:1175 stop:1558 length:384 start_codon:yes stop_codon:yes gene_type:complete
MNTFKGKVTHIDKVREGKGEKGPWASINFEVTELDPKNPAYPQIGLFGLFKNGEYIKYAKDFATYYPEGTPVEVEFTLKKSVYQKKDGSGEGAFYSMNAFKINKVEEGSEDVIEYPEDEVNPEDIPF